MLCLGYFLHLAPRSTAVALVRVVATIVVPVAHIARGDAIFVRAREFDTRVVHRQMRTQICTPDLRSICSLESPPRSINTHGRSLRTESRSCVPRRICIIRTIVETVHGISIVRSLGHVHARGYSTMSWSRASCKGHSGSGAVCTVQCTCASGALSAAQ